MEDSSLLLKLANLLFHNILAQIAMKSLAG
jgi:hypothetical protein